MKPAKASPRLSRLLSRLRKGSLNFGSQTLSHLGAELALRAYFGLELSLTPAELCILEAELGKLAELEDIREAIRQQQMNLQDQDPEDRLGLDLEEIHTKGNFWPRARASLTGSSNRKYPLASGRRRW